MECRWFLKCKNEATVLLPHPILGDVPCCDRCAKLAEADPKDLKSVDQLLEGDGVLTLGGITAGREVWRDVHDIMLEQDQKGKPS